jgi:hypothetical protein
MEHRSGNRMSVSMSVEVFRSGEHQGCFQSKNISHGGLLLDGHKLLKKGDFLTVKIPNYESDEPKYYWLKVMVVHSSQCSAGLMWVDCNVSFLNELDFILAAVA